MPPRTPIFAAHASLDVWQFIRLAPRSSLLRQTQPGATTHDRTPTAPRGVGEGELGGSGDGLGGDVDGALARRAVLFEEVVVAPGCEVLLHLAGRRDGCSPPGKLTCRSSCPGGLREGKRPGRKSSFWPCAWCLTVMIKPAAEGGGQPIRGRGVALERGVAGTGPASGGVRGEALPSEALQAPLGRTASLGPTAFFSVREVGGRGGRGRRVLGVLGVGPGSLRGVGRGGCSEPVGKCVYSH